MISHKYDVLVPADSFIILCPTEMAEIAEILPCVNTIFLVYRIPRTSYSTHILYTAYSTIKFLRFLRFLRDKKKTVSAGQKRKNYLRGINKKQSEDDFESDSNAHRSRRSPKLLEIYVPSWQWLCERVQVFSQHFP